MREHNVVVKSANNDHSGIDDEGPDELNELEMLAGIQRTHNQPLEISDDDELRGAEDPRQDTDEKADSVGAESSYSDFMQAWKNKLFSDDKQ